MSRLISLLRRNKNSSLFHLFKDSSIVSNEAGFELIKSCDASNGVGLQLLKVSNFSNGAGFLSSRFALNYGNAFFRSKFMQKGFSFQPSKNMSTTASLLAPNKSEVVKEGVTLLVNKGTEVQKQVGIWIFGCAAWVFSMVVLGGVTRLTRSGLSMTDWKFSGRLPPLSEEEWQLEFEKYKQSPEYKRVNRGMSLENFKFIYWMEYAHRMWGRGLGIIFAMPFTYFLAKGYITRQLGLRLSALFALGAGQGLIGWWMVKSGLEIIANLSVIIRNSYILSSLSREPASEYAQPRVSPYRLATHLTSAFIIYCGLFWTGLSVVMPQPPTGSLSWIHGAAKARTLAIPVSILVGVTALSGAFVAGNDAGHAYNTFPKMGDSWIPDEIFELEPIFRNFFENTATVQLDHRILATATLLSIGGMWWATKKLDLHPAVQSLIGSTLGMAALQVTLGISTLLSYVPVSLATAHQAGALTLLTLMLLLVHSVRKPSPALLKSLSSSLSNPTAKVMGQSNKKVKAGL